MAGEASLAEQTTDEQIEGNKVIDGVKIVEEDGVSQPKQTEGSELGKEKVEKPASSETSAADSRETIENKHEASATEEVKKEGGDDMPFAPGVLEDKKEDAPVVDEVEKGTEDSEASGSKVLGENKDGAPLDEDAKKEAETGKNLTISDAEVEASIRDPAEKSISITDSLSEAAENTLLDSSSSSVQESEQVGCEPEVSEPAAETAKSIEKSLDVSTNPDVAPEAVVKLEEHSMAFIVKGPAADATGEVDRKNEISETDDTVEASKDENIATVKGETVSEPLKEESAVEPESSASQVLVPDSATVELGRKNEVYETDEVVEASKSENISTVEGEIVPEPLKDEPVVEPGSSASEALDTLPADSATGELERKDETSVTDDILEASKIENIATVDRETVSEPLKEESVVDTGSSAFQALDTVPADSEIDDVVEASKDENIVTVESATVSEPLKEESAVEPGSSASRALDTVPADSAEVEAKDVGGYSVSENTEKAGDDVNANVCPAEVTSEESEHNSIESLGKEVIVNTSLPNPPIAVGKTEPVGTVLVTEAAEIVVKPDTDFEEQKGDKTVETELVKEEKTMEEEPVKEQEGEKSVKTGSTLTAPKEVEASFEEVKPLEDADKVFEQRDLDVSAPSIQPTENLEKEKASKVTEESTVEQKYENGNIEENSTLVQTSRDIDQIGTAIEASDKVVEQRELGASGSTTESVEKLEKEEASAVAEAFAKEPKRENEKIEDDKTLRQTSRDIDLREQSSETDKSIREAEVKLEPQKSDVDAAEKDETVKGNEGEKNNAQDLVESSKDGTDSKTNLELQKAEASGKSSKTLMSKVKHSIVKVKKAIIGKSPSSKTMSAESKDEPKMK